MHTVSRGKTVDIDHDAIINRLKEMTGKATDKDLAEMLDMKKGNFSARKQRDSLIDVVAEWGIKNDVDLNYLMKGKKVSSLKYGFLSKISDWIDSLSKEDTRTLPWFELQFEKKFPDFKKWKEEGAETEHHRSVYPTSKVA